MFEEIKTIDKIEIVENGIIQIRRADKVLKDGVEIAKTHHRWSLSPGQDVSDQEPRVQAVCEVIWTPEVIKAYQEILDERFK